MFSGLRRAVSAIARTAKRFLGGSKGTATNAPAELDVIPEKREYARKERDRKHHGGRGQPFPIKHAALHQAIRAAVHRKGDFDRGRLMEDAKRIAKEMRDAWETRVDDGFLYRREA